MTTLFEALRHDHDKHRDLLDRLEKTSGMSRERQELLKQLKAEVEHHMKDEEHGIFQLAGKVLPEHSKQMLATTFENEKERELERLAP